MANDVEYERLKQALMQANTPEARREAAEALRRYEEERKKKGQTSRPTIVSLHTKKTSTVPNAVPLDKAAEEMEKNPAFFDFLKKVIG